MDVVVEFVILVRSVISSFVVVVNNSLGDEGGEVVIGVLVDIFNGDSDVGGVYCIIVDMDIRVDEVSFFFGEKRGVVFRVFVGEVGEVFFGKFNDLFVGDVIRVDEDYVVSSVVVFDVVGKFGVGDIVDVFVGVEDGVVKGLVLESSSVKVVENNFFDLFFDFFGFVEDDVVFMFDGGRFEFGVLENVGDNVDVFGNVGVESFSEVDGVFMLDGGLVIMLNVVILFGFY